MGLAQWLVVVVAVQRLLEVAYGVRNTKRLLADGGVAHGTLDLPLLVSIHAGWLIAILLLVPANTPGSYPLLAVYAALQVVRYWIMASLGRFWTTRVITLPGAPLVARGPYKYVRHPNYLVVAAEIAVLPLAFGAWKIALAFSVVNGLALWYRIRIENAALAPRR